MSTQYSLLVASLQNIRWDSRLHSKLADLYVVVKLGGVNKQTRVVKKNLSPSWDETLTISSSDPREDLVIEIRHKSIWKSDPCIGFARIRLDELLGMCAGSEAPSPLFLRKKGSGAPAGTLHLCLKTANLIANAALDVNAANKDIQLLAKMEAEGSTIAAPADDVSKLSTKGSLYKSVGVLLSKLDVFVGFIDDMSKLHPYLAVAWQVTSILYKGVSRTFKADKKVIDLILLVVGAFNFARDTNTLRDKSQFLEVNIINLLKQTTECCLFVKDYVRRNFTGRILDIGSITKIDEFSESLAALKNVLDSGIGLHTAFVSARILDKVDDLHLQQRLSRLNPDPMNAFNRPLCLPGTRSEIQKEIVDWMISDSDQNIFWLHGVAGSGKSTISTTIAEHFRGLHRLGAFLFFERGKSDPTSVIRTLAYGLAHADPSIAKQIGTAIEHDNDVASASAASQFEELIMKPLMASAVDLRGPVLIVLDALDECGTLETRRALLELLRRELHKLPKNIRFLITSRRETDIERALSNQPDIVQIVELDYTSSDSRRDVLAYLRVEMTRIVKDEVAVPDDWPWEDNMILLADAAEGLFVWASTATKLVSLYRDDPFQKLKDLVSDLLSLTRFGLNDLYANVLHNSGIPWTSGTSRARFSQVIGLVLLSRTPLSISTIDGILGFPTENSSKHIFSGLQCLLVYSADGPIHLFHTSFSDYLMSPERSSDPWCIDISAQMTFITSRCFSIMKDMLHFNMCSLESSFVPNDRFHGLEGRIKENIPLHLEYACLYWSQHLSVSSPSSMLLGELSDFVYNRLLYWLEVLSLLKNVGAGDSALLIALQRTGPDDDGLAAFLTDARKLLTMFSFPISQCTPHIYISMLPLMSKESLLAAHYFKRTSSLVPVERIEERGSAPLLRLSRLTTSYYKIGTFSPDCTRIALGFPNGDIHMWNVESGEMLFKLLKGHSDEVTTIAFSSDGARMVSGSEDHTIRSWIVASGESTASSFEGHTGGVTSVAFSPNGSYIASGSRDRTVIIWDSWSGIIVSGPLQKHTDSVLSIDFSPDGTHVISGSRDKTLFLWDVESGQALFSFKGHKGRVSCVNFSPDGTRIVSGSYGMVIVWNARTGEVVCGPFKGDAGGVNCVKFSRDGSRIVSGGFTTIRIWNGENGNATSTALTGHNGTVLSANFSLDGTRILSCSDSGEIGVWDVAGAEAALERSEVHPSEVLLVAYSPDGNIISVYSGNLIRIWDVRSGEVTSNSLPFHGNNVALSPDGTHFARSNDQSINIFDTESESGETISTPLLGYSEIVWYLYFSPDGTQLVSCSHGISGFTIIVWNVENKKILYGPFEKNKAITSISFSPDGIGILLGLTDGTIEVCNVESGDGLTSPFKGHAVPVTTLSLSPCGTRFASGSSWDNNIVVWDYKIGQIVSSLTTPGVESKSSITFSPDGLRIASSIDTTVMVWDVASSALIFGPFAGLSNYILSVAFSPEGTSLVSGSEDGTIRIWDITKENPASRLGKQEEGDISVSSSHDYANWDLGEDGWIRGIHDELLLWIPSALRNTLWRAQNTAFYGGDFQTRLDFSNCLHGERWHECFKPPHQM